MIGSEKDSRLVKALDMERLQNIQDNLAKALGLAFVTVDYRGFPVTRPSGFADFCDCMRSHKKYGHLCSQCYAHGGLHATIAGEPCLYRCHAGLVEFAVPVMVDGRYVGSVMGGQCEPDRDTTAFAPILPHRTPWEEVPELVRTRGSVHKTTTEKLQASISLTQDILRSLLEEEHSRDAQEELVRKNRELMEEKAARANLELSVKDGKSSGEFMEHVDKEHLFFMLNVISRLAFLEKAEETERTACDFADMMRYVLENGEYSCVTLGEELEYIDYYLRIQKRRMEGRLRYEINVPEKDHSALCPFMLLHPLVKKTVRFVMDNSREGGILTIRSREEKELLVLSIGCEFAGLAGQQFARLPDQDGKRQGKTIPRLDRSLKNTFGQNCGITFRNREDSIPGMEIEVRLPLQGGVVNE